MGRKIFFCSLLFSLFVVVCEAQLLRLPPRFESWMESPGMRHATVAVEIVDLDRDSLILAYDNQRAVQPASLLKLFTTAAALRMLGGDYVMPDTVLRADTSEINLPELKGYNADWLIEDVGAYYAEPLDSLPEPGTTLREYVKLTNEKSLNNYAEALPYLLTPEGSLDAGIDAIKAYWSRQGIDTEALVMYDGCGLAPADRVTAHMVSQLLKEMKDDADFRNSFAIAGMSGTVMYFLKASYLSGRAQLKTGTTKSVTAYAGYVRGSNNHTYSIAFIVNNSTAPLTVQRKNIEKMFILLIP